MATSCKRTLPPTADAFLPTKKQRTSSSAWKSAFLPEDLVVSDILPRFSVKSLGKFQLVCHRWQSALEEPRFMLEQSRRRSSVSSGLAYFDEKNKICFLPTFGVPVGVPNPNPLPEGHRFELVASSNGLLCIQFHGSPQHCIVCNPVTLEANRFTLPGHETDFSIGLAFDPSVSPDGYTLVLAFRFCIKGRSSSRTFGFNVFSSLTSKCTTSRQKVEVGSAWRPSKVVYAAGVLYWYGVEYVLFYDPEKDAAGCFMPPNTKEERYEEEIGVWDDKLTCTRATSKGIEVWVMAERGKWEMRHFMCMEAVLKANEVFSEYCHLMSVRSRTNWDGLRQRRMIRPLPYEGGRAIYVRIMVKEKKSDQEVIICCNMDSGKAEMFRKSELGNRHWWQPFFPFHNSLAKLPPLFTSVDRLGSFMSNVSEKLACN